MSSWVRAGDRHGVRRVESVFRDGRRRMRVRLVCVYCGGAYTANRHCLTHVAKRCHLCGAGGRPESVTKSLGPQGHSRQDLARRIAICETLLEEYPDETPGTPWEQSPRAQMARAMLGQLSLTECGIIMGLSRERIRQLEMRGIVRAKQALEREGWSVADILDQPNWRVDGRAFAWAGRL